MRILVVTNLYPNPLEPERAPFNRYQVRALSAQHPVQIISPIAWTRELAVRSRGRIPHHRRVICDGIVVDHPRYWYTPKVMRNCYGHFFSRSIRRTFARALREFQPELVLASWAYPDGWAAVELGHRVGLPVVIKVHGCDILVGGDGLDRHPVRRRKTVEALRKADGVIAVSRDLSEKVADLGVDPGRVRVVHNGIDAGLFHPGPRGEARARLGLDPEEPIIVFVGALVEVKAVNVLIAACAKLLAAREPFSCYLIGTGPQRQSLEKQVKRLGLEAVVHFQGPRPHRQLPDWYRAANVAVLPSRSEGIPNVLLEAIACGTPFVATRVGGIPEIAHFGTGRLVPPGDPMALASALAASFVQPASAGQAIHSHAASACEVARFLEETLSHGPAAAVPRG